MTLQLVGEMKRKLDHVPRRLGDDFPDADPKQLALEVEHVAEQLLEDARFGDFVPVLAYRYTREHLLDDHVPVRRAA